MHDAEASTSEELWQDRRRRERFGRQVSATSVGRHERESHRLAEGCHEVINQVTNDDRHDSISAAT